MTPPVEAPHDLFTMSDRVQPVTLTTMQRHALSVLNEANKHQLLYGCRVVIRRTPDKPLRWECTSREDCPQHKYGSAG
jgi:hypothetical protein